MAAGERPDFEMIAPIERIARFMETLDARLLENTFAAGGVILIENFPPYVFQGHHAAARWAMSFAKHAKNITGLRHSFGDPQDFSRQGETVFLSLPTTWTGASGGRPFVETGGWAFVLVRQARGWRVRNYGWAVTSIVLK